MVVLINWNEASTEEEYSVPIVTPHCTSYEPLLLHLFVRNRNSFHRMEQYQNVIKEVKKSCGLRLVGKLSNLAGSHSTTAFYMFSHNYAIQPTYPNLFCTFNRCSAIIYQLSNQLGASWLHSPPKTADRNLPPFCLALNFKSGVELVFNVSNQISLLPFLDKEGREVSKCGGSPTFPNCF